MNLDEVLQYIRTEVSRASELHPNWPIDPIHAMAVLGEEYGELNKALLQYTYEPHKNVTFDDIQEEAVQTAAMAIRFLVNLESYNFKRSPSVVN